MFLEVFVSVNVLYPPNSSKPGEELINPAGVLNTGSLANDTVNASGFWAFAPLLHRHPVLLVFIGFDEKL